MKKGKSNLKVISHILVLALVLVIAVVATFSWYNRTQSAGETGYLLEYTQSGNVNGTGGTIQTFAGTDNNGMITYADTEVSGTISTEPGAVSYFKTVITDESNSGDSMVSLYLEDFTYSSKMGSAIHIGIIQPEKTYKKFTGTLSGSNYIVDKICLEDNVPVANNGTVEVYWFVEIDATYSGTGSVDLGTLHLVYN